MTVAIDFPGGKRNLIINIRAQLIAIILFFAKAIYIIAISWALMFTSMCNVVFFARGFTDKNINNVLFNLTTFFR